MDYSRININIPVYLAIAKYDLVSENKQGNPLPGSDGCITNQDIKEIIRDKELTMFELFMEFDTRLQILNKDSKEYQLLNNQYKKLYQVYYDSDEADVEFEEYLNIINQITPEEELRVLLIEDMQSPLTGSKLQRARELMEKISGEPVPESLQYIQTPEIEIEDPEVIPGDILDAGGIPLA